VIRFAVTPMVGSPIGDAVTSKYSCVDTAWK
jgi:hypothetical protein